MTYVCPVCHVTEDYYTGAVEHLTGCQWLALEARIVALEVRCKSLLQLVERLDDRTIGSAKIGGR